MLETAVAPDFTVEVANGPSIVLSELWHEHYLLLWFSRGLACPFCRRQMVQLGRIGGELRENGVAPIQIGPTDQETARSLLQFYPVPWPYACDPSGQIAAAYDLAVSGGSLAAALADVKQQSHAWGLLLAHPGEPYPEILPTVNAVAPPPARDGGMAIVDRNGRVRFKQPSGKLSLLPSNDGILKAVRQVVSGVL